MNSEGGISSIGIWVRSLTYINLRLGVPKLDYKGVNDEIGLPNSMNCVPSAALEVSAGVVDEKGNII